MKKINICLSLIAFVIIGSLVYSYISNGNDRNRINLFGYIMNYVQSGSMYPTIETYDLVLSKTTTFEEVKVGDIITYECNYEQTEDGTVVETDETKVIIHRVVDKTDDYLITKGDANLIQDPWVVVPEKIISKQVYIISNPFE